MQIKIMSLNIWHGGRLFDAAVDFIRQENPDILALQEVYDGTDPHLETRFRCYTELRHNLKYPHSVFDTEFIDNLAEGRIPQGNAVFSRFPIANHSVDMFMGPIDQDYRDEDKKYAEITRNVQTLELATPEGLVNFINFHGVWGLEGEADSPDRKKMSDALLGAAAGKPRCILVGDTNAKPVNPALQRVEEKLVSVFGDTLASTFNMRQKDNPGYASAAVDMIFVSQDVRVISKAVPDVDISDHLPVIATVEI